LRVDPANNSSTNSKGRLSFERRDYTRAMSLFEKCQNVLGGDATGQARKVIPRLHLQMGKVQFVGLQNYEEARSCLESARDLFTETPETEHEILLESLIWLGRLYSVTGDLPKALKELESAREITERDSDLNSPLRGDALHYLGVCLSKMHVLDRAHFNLVEGLRIRLVNYGSNYPCVGESHSRLAHLELQLGKQKSSLEHFVEAIRVGMLPLKAGEQLKHCEITELRKDFEVSLSLALPHGDAETIGKLWHEKGTLQSLTRSYDDALVSYREAITCYKQCYGDVHLSIGNVLLNCGICMNATDDFGGAIKCLTQSLVMTKQELGEEHDQVADVLVHLSDSYRRHSDLKQALRCCEEALRIRRRTEISIALAQLLKLAGELVSAYGCLLNCMPSNISQLFGLCRMLLVATPPKPSD
jgi:tetratricopeptide (TPR) repeat protein